jgi:Sulfotransferase family
MGGSGYLKIARQLDARLPGSRSRRVDRPGDEAGYGVAAGSECHRPELARLTFRESSGSSATVLRVGIGDRTSQRADPACTFLIGAARSGTSLLYKCLCLHPDAAYFNNYMRRLPGHPAVSITNHIARMTPEHRRRVWFSTDSNAYVYAGERKLRHRMYPMPVEGEPVYAACRIPDAVSNETVSPNAARELRRAVNATMRWGGGAHFINKRIANVRRIPLLAKAFPNARFVDITRDGRAVAVSLSLVDWWETSVVWWYGDTPKAWRDDGRDPWELCARNWVEEVRAIDSGLGDIEPERVCRLTYEEFVAAPEATIFRVAAFAGLRDDTRWRDEIAGIHVSNRNHDWRQDLLPDVVTRIEDVQAEELSKHGYA